MVASDAADGELVTLRARLSRAGLLEVPTPVAERPDPRIVAEGRSELGRGGLLASDAVSDGRG